jgi:hypothetical protein
MGSISRVVASLGLMAALYGTALLGPGPALASDEEDHEQHSTELNQDLVDSEVSGVVYEIVGNDSQQVVTIYDTGVGRGVDAYVRAPALLAMVKRKDVCVGRFVTAHGVRIGETTMDVEGFVVDQATQCGKPPR